MTTPTQTTKTLQASDVSCPGCGSAAGKRCTTSRGVPTVAHPARWEAARQAREQADSPLSYNQTRINDLVAKGIWNDVPAKPAAPAAPWHLCVKSGASYVNACDGSSGGSATGLPPAVTCPTCKALMALSVMVLDRSISGFLAVNDRMARRQALDALRAFPAMDIDGRIAAAVNGVSP